MNFSEMDPSEFKTEQRQIEGFESVSSELVFDFAERYGGKMSNQRPESSQEHD